MDRSIPTTLDEIRPDWLTEALLEGGVIEPGTTVTGCDAVVLGTGVGFAGDLARLSVSYDGGGGPATMVAKIPTSIDDNRGGSEMLGIYEREIRMYEDILPSLGMPVPGLYFADVDPNPDWDKQIETIKKAERLPIWVLRILAWILQRVVKPELRASVLILEDLAPAEIGDQVAGATVDRIGKVLELSARMHATTWGDKQPIGGSWLVSGGIAPKLTQASFLGIRRKFLKADGRNVSAHMRALIGRIARDGLERGRRLHDGHPQCLLHGDLRLDNIFFENGDVRALIDWQLTHFGPAVLDVAYFITGSVDPAVPESEIDGLLGRYHRALVAAGVDDYSYERFVADYDDALLSVLGSVSAVVLLDMGDDRGRDLVDAWVARLDARLARIPA